MTAQKKTTLPHPFVTVVVPCLNEKWFIEKCLNSLIATDYPKENLEIIIVDGLSCDGSYEIAQSYAHKYSYISVVKNPKRNLASAWNLGIQKGKGEFIMTLIAHAVFPENYIRKCIHYLQTTDAALVGGVLETLSPDSSLRGQAIVRVLTHPLGVGSSHFRIGSKKPRIVDDVAFGGFKRAVFKKIGLFNEELTRSQDANLHRRMNRAGLKILLIPEIKCQYYTRARLKDFFRMNYINGFWVTHPLKLGVAATRWRHWIPLLFILSLLTTFVTVPFISLSDGIFTIILGSYLLAILGSSLQITIKKRNIFYFFLMPILFLGLHFNYGIGSLVGLIQAITSKRFWISLRKFDFYSPRGSLS